MTFSCQYVSVDIWKKNCTNSISLSYCQSRRRGRCGLQKQPDQDVLPSFVYLKFNRKRTKYRTHLFINKPEKRRKFDKSADYSLLAGRGACNFDLLCGTLWTKKISFTQSSFSQIHRVNHIGIVVRFRLKRVNFNLTNN